MHTYARVFSIPAGYRALGTTAIICLMLLVASFCNKLSAQGIQQVEDPCVSYITAQSPTANQQTAQAAKTQSGKLKLSELDPALYKYWNESNEDKAAKIKKVESDLNAKKTVASKDVSGKNIASPGTEGVNVVTYQVDPCDDPGDPGPGCTISPPAIDSESTCGPGNVNLYAYPGSGGNSVRWYETDFSSEVISTSTTFTVYVTTSRYYYVSSYNTSNGCESTRIEVYVSVGGWGVDGTITAPVTAIYLGQSLQISSSGGTGTPHYWCSTNGGTTWNIFSASYIGQPSFSYTPLVAGTFRFMLRNKGECGFCYDNGSCPNYPYIDIVVINGSSPTPSSQSSFIYGYNNSIVTAEVTNANQNQIAFSSFESSDKGNWTYSGTPVGSATDLGRTGNKYYNLASGNIQRTGTQKGKYTLTYWAVGDPAVTGTNYTLVSKTTETTINGWILYRVIFSLSADQSTITISGTAKIDEARLHPYDALMATSTYDPLIGKTSETDPNNRTTYYIYDEFNRIKIIKDQSGNIRKSMSYNYKN